MSNLPTYYCDGACSCPPDSHGEIPPHADLTEPLLLANSNGDGTGRVVITYHSLDDYCKTTPLTGIRVRDHTDEIVARFTTGTCSASGGGFHATASDGAWSLDVRIPHFSGYGTKYDLYVGSAPTFTIKGPVVPTPTAFKGRT